MRTITAIFWGLVLVLVILSIPTVLIWMAFSNLQQLEREIEADKKLPRVCGTVLGKNMVEIYSNGSESFYVIHVPIDTSGDALPDITSDLVCRDDYFMYRDTRPTDIYKVCVKKRSQLWEIETFERQLLRHH